MNLLWESSLLLFAKASFHLHSQAKTLTQTDQTLVSLISNTLKRDRNRSNTSNVGLIVPTNTDKFTLLVCLSSFSSIQLQIKLSHSPFIFAPQPESLWLLRPPAQSINQLPFSGQQAANFLVSARHLRCWITKVDLRLQAARFKMRNAKVCSRADVVYQFCSLWVNFVCVLIISLSSKTYLADRFDALQSIRAQTWAVWVTSCFLEDNIPTLFAISLCYSTGGLCSCSEYLNSLSIFLFLLQTWRMA